MAKKQLPEPGWFATTPSGYPVGASAFSFGGRIPPPPRPVPDPPLQYPAWYDEPEQGLGPAFSPLDLTPAGALRKAAIGGGGALLSRMASQGGRSVPGMASGARGVPGMA